MFINSYMTMKLLIESRCILVHIVHIGCSHRIICSHRILNLLVVPCSRILSIGSELRCLNRRRFGLFITNKGVALFSVDLFALVISEWLILNLLGQQGNIFAIRRWAE